MNLNKDSILFRINFIKNLLKNKLLTPLIDFDNKIDFIKSQQDNSDKDTRNVLNKHSCDFKEIIASQIGGKLSYIKSGTTGHTFYGISSTGTNNEQSFEYAVKVVAYPKKDKASIYDIRRPENAEIMILKILSFFIIKKQTPHIVLPIASFYTDIKNFTNLIDDNYVEKDNKKYNEFIEKYKKGEYHDEVSILISEWANNGDLLDFVKKKYLLFDSIHWKVIFFQILSTLAIIQSKFPAFRHNDLKANNILVHKIENNNNRHTYTVNEITYKIPNIGYHMKMWDYDFACIQGIADNQKVNTKWTNTINITSKQNKYYDLHYFFNTLIRKGFFPEFMTSSAIPQEAKDFVNRIIPPEYRQGKYVHERGRILINDEYTTPLKILQEDVYFEEFRNYEKNYIKRIKSIDIDKDDDVKISDIIKLS
jgi:hypothetical protein